MENRKVRKLQLNKETVRVLNESELQRVVGGTLPSGDGCAPFTTENCPTGDCGGCFGFLTGPITP